MIHGRAGEAARIVDEIQQRVERDGVHLGAVPAGKALMVAGHGAM